MEGGTGEVWGIKEEMSRERAGGLRRGQATGSVKVGWPQGWRGRDQTRARSGDGPCARNHAGLHLRTEVTRFQA